MSVDVAISFDTTGSIYPALSEIRRRLQTFLNDLFTTVPDLRISITAHGDYNDAYDPITIPFTTDKKKLAEFVRTVGQTNGFGNGGEAYEWVMNKVNELDWQADQRVFILIGDEPAHRVGTRIHTSSYGKNHTVQYDWRIEQQRLISHGIKTYVVRCLNRSDSINFHHELVQMNNVPLLELAQFNNIVEMLTAITYKQVSDDRVKEYAEDLKNTGQLNRNLAAIIDGLLNTTYSKAKVFEARTDGLVPVEPSRFQVLRVPNRVAIKDFVNSTGARFRVGQGFYELTKREEIQERKEVILVHKATGDMFSGSSARDLIGLPYGMRDNKSPRDVPHEYKAFVQSTSSNRVLMPNTDFLYEVEHY